MVKFVDLQFVKRSRPTIDLNYFFCSSTTSQFREKHFQNLLTHYHNILTSELKQMGYPEDLYPMAQLVDDYNDCFCFGFIAGFFHAQVVKKFWFLFHKRKQVGSFVSQLLSNQWTLISNGRFSFE